MIKDVYVLITDWNDDGGSGSTCIGAYDMISRAQQEMRENFLYHLAAAQEHLVDFFDSDNNDYIMGFSERVACLKMGVNTIRWEIHAKRNVTLPADHLP